MRNLMLNGLTGAERDDMLALLENAQKIINLICKRAEEDLERQEESFTNDLDNPNWALKQAYLQGYKKGLTKIKDYAIIKP